MPKNVVVVLIAISVIGVLGMPLGDPKFLAVGVALEASYIALTIVSVKNIKNALIPNMVIAGIVIAGNTASPPHRDIMLSLNPIYNAIILIIGGYILQALLIVTSLSAYKKMRHVAIRERR